MNVFLNLFFVLALGMNVEGVAIATVISNAVSSAILFVGLLRTEGVLRVHIGKLRLDHGSFRWVMKIGLPAGAAIALVLAAGRTLLALFNRDPEVIACGHTRLVVIFFAYAFSMTYEMIAGYLRGFGISMVPAVLTMLGVCGVRIVWVYTAFAANRTFDTLLLAYPLSLAVTAALLLGALLFYRPAAELAKENAAVR